ncbi:MAG: T9SS type A sorting domain-containing protein [Bacteroidales bacterium]|nr:T9SS type A sorting domain-containing protein [Bacteroidales bacterium]
MKKKYLLTAMITLFSLTINCQITYHFSEDFSAECDFSKSASQTHIFKHQDSIIIEDVIYEQCCPKFALQISDIVNDSLYVNFYDTAFNKCDCMCYFNVRINAGKCLLPEITIIYNGATYILADYDSLVVESRLWSNLSGGYGSEVVECCRKTTYLKFETDPYVNTPFEKQVLASTDSLETWQKIGNIKETDKKIYFRDINNKQGLLYDFGASVGDLIKIVNYSLNINPDTLIAEVVDIDTLEYLGIDRKRFEVRDTFSDQSDFWIEGIGSVKGLLNPCLELEGGFRELLCVHDNERLIYKNEERGVCFMEDTVTFIETKEFSDFRIFPNPSNGFIRVESNSEQDYNYAIYNTVGQLMDQGKLKQVVQLELNQGVYVITIYDKQKVVYRQKILIE